MIYFKYMSNIQQLINFIAEYRTYGEVNAKAFQINPSWRQGTWGRELRKHKEIVADKKGIKQNDPIIGYYPENTPPEAQNSPLTHKKVGWREKLHLEKEKAKIEKMRGEDGKIRLFT